MNQDIRHEVRSACLKNIAALKTAMNTPNQSRFVFVWTDHWLSVQINVDYLRVVPVDRGTMVRSSDKRVFTNGAGKRAVLMERGRALAGALKHAESVYDSMKEILAA